MGVRDMWCGEWAARSLLMTLLLPGRWHAPSAGLRGLPQPSQHGRRHTASWTPIYTAGNPQWAFRTRPPNPRLMPCSSADGEHYQAGTNCCSSIGVTQQEIDTSTFLMFTFYIDSLLREQVNTPALEDCNEGVGVDGGC